MIPVTFHPQAETELDHSIAFYEEREPGLGLDFYREVHNGIAKIQESPGRYPSHLYGTRKFLLNRFPFHIFYLEFQNYVWIVAIAHCSRKPNYWKNRL